MRLFDVTRPIEPAMPIYAGEPRPEIEHVKSRARGDLANVSKLSLGAHTGTHVDAPCHFLDGAPGVDAWPVEQLCGPARVVAISNDRAVEVGDLERARLPGGTERVLFKTANGALWEEKAFHADYVFIDPEAARWLVARGVRLVGIDYLSVEKFGAKEPETHFTLLESGVAIVEGLDLRAVPEGAYELFALPLRVVACDAAPARVILRASA